MILLPKSIGMVELWVGVFRLHSGKKKDVRKISFKLSLSKLSHQAEVGLARLRKLKVFVKSK